MKVVSIATNKVVRIFGQSEKAERVLSIALYQGIHLVDQQLLLSKQENAVSKNGKWDRACCVKKRRLKKF